ncbi:hypothetical protein EC991_000937, partial [Linnemannia zychae]
MASPLQSIQTNGSTYNSGSVRSGSFQVQHSPQGPSLEVGHQSPSVPMRRPDMGSDVDGQTGPCNPTEEDEVEADPSIGDVAANAVESTNELRVDAAQEPSAESDEDADVDPTDLFKVEPFMSSSLDVTIVNYFE